MLKKFRLPVLLFALLMTVGMLFACNKKQDEPDDTSGSGTTEPAKEMVTLFEGGEFRYAITFPRNGGGYESRAASALKATLREYTDVLPETLSDNAQYSEEKREILIGFTAYPESAEIYKDLKYGDYRIAECGNKIVIAAYSESALNKAMSAFREMIGTVSSKDEGRIRLPADFETVACDAPLLSELPVISAEKITTYCVSANNSYVLAAEKTTQEAYTAALSAAEAQGYEKYAEQEMAGNLFATYKNDKNVLNLSYFVNEKTVRMTVDSLSYTSLPAAKENYLKQGTTTLNLLGVSKSTFQNGMSLFIRTADRRFVVFDGGQGAADAENLYNQLKASAAAVGRNDIEIAAWVITHAHSDHMGAFAPFLSKYSDSVKVDSLIISPAGTQYGSANGSTAENDVLSAYRAAYDNGNVIITHAGQTFWFADVRMDILFTLDAMMPYEFTDYNAASIISRLQIGGKTVLVTGDAYMDTMDFIADTYGDFLKCDYLQVPHHGDQGGTIKAYKLMAPSELLWPAGPELFDMVTTPGYRSYSQNIYLLDTMKLRSHLHLAGVLGNVTEIKF